MKTVALYTLGCRLNQAETAVLRHSLTCRGFRVVPEGRPSEIAVVNTCTVTSNGDTDARRLLHRIRRLNPNVRIALTGCQAQTQKEALARWPNVRWVVGNGSKMDLAEVLAASGDEGGVRVLAPPIGRDPFVIEGTGLYPNRTRAHLKIQDGCDAFCSFCEIPFARGRARSRLFDDVMREAAALAAAGHREVVLTGINLGCYRDGDRDLTDVIRGLSGIRGLARIRISSIEPTTIPHGLLDLMIDGDRLCRSLHVPLQSADDGVLRRMRRGYTAAQFAAWASAAKERVPDLSLGTDVIAGFPGEDETAFARSIEVLKRMPIDYMHVFPYSPRTRAKSARYADAVPVEEVRRRSRLLREVGGRKRRLCLERQIGSVRPVLFERERDGAWEGLTDNYLRVRVETGGNPANRIVRVRLIGVEGTALIGRIEEGEGG